jgi:hypothetical protein
MSVGRIPSCEPEINFSARRCGLCLPDKPCNSEGCLDDVEARAAKKQAQELKKRKGGMPDLRGILTYWPAYLIAFWLTFACILMLAASGLHAMRLL